MQELIGYKNLDNTKANKIDSDLKEFMNSNRYETNVTKIPHIVVLKVTFEKPWSVSVNQTDVLHLKICKQDFPADLIEYTNSEGCLELLKNVPLQNYD